MKKLSFILLSIPLFFLGWSAKAQTSPLESGDIYKISIEKRGVYKITPTFLKQIGINQNVNPNFIKILGMQGGMLPEKNTQEIPVLKEIPIKIIGGQDNSFEGEDVILFYGEDADKIIWDQEKEFFSYSKNFYARKNYFYIKIDNSSENKKIITATETQKNYDTTTKEGIEVIHYQQWNENILNSGRKWAGDSFRNKEKHIVSMQIPKVAPRSSIKLRCELISQSFTVSHFLFSIFDITIGEISFPISRSSRSYSPVGIMKTEIIEFNEEKVNLHLSKTRELPIRIDYIRNDIFENGYLNSITLNIKKPLYWESERFHFSLPASLSQQTTQVHIDNAQIETHIWDTSNPLNPMEMKTTLDDDGLYFLTNTGTEGRFFFVFAPQNIPHPIFIEKIPNQQIHKKIDIDYLIITPDVFFQEAVRLAQWREENDKLKTEVIQVEKIYTEYASGRQDIFAIRNFIRKTYEKGNKTLKYVLLFGDASFDYLDILKEKFGFVNTNFVPSYQTVESLDPLKSFVSDDFFGFLDIGEGLWDTNQEQKLEIGIGRLPVTTVEEARIVVNKLIAYDSKSTVGAWKNKILFVADDGDNNLHQKQADELANLIDISEKGMKAQRLFIDAFPQKLTSLGKRSPILQEKIKENTESGVLILNYTGHGSESRWATEDILNSILIEKWENYHTLPLFITATCEFGRYDNPLIKSGAEYAITYPNGGGIALISTTRPVFADENFTTNKSIYQVLLNSDKLRIGDIVRLSKNAIENNVNNRSFVLLGDPATKLSFPAQKIQIQRVNDQQITNTLTFKAFNSYTVEGEIVDNEGRIETFDGIVYLNLFEKPSKKYTLGDEVENTVMEFEEYNNLLFQGKSTVSKGRFKATFFIPKDIKYELGKGKINMYAVNDNQNQEASGSFTNFLIGNTKEKDMETDNIPPEINIFFNDILVKNHTTISIPTALKIEVSDNNSINTTGIGIGHDFKARIDNKIEYTLNDKFIFYIDSYQKGAAELMLENLTEGKHTLSVKVWDSYNNVAEKEIVFYVLIKQIVIEKILTYPNPFSTSISFSIKQNAQDELLTVFLDIFNYQGKPIYNEIKNLFSSGEKVEEISWEGIDTRGNKVPNGMYIYNIKLTNTKYKKSNNYSNKILLNRK